MDRGMDGWQKMNVSDRKDTKDKISESEREDDREGAGLVTQNTDVSVHLSVG